MFVIHIDSRDGNIDQFNEYLKQGKQIFVLFYMEGCGPCNATRPEWKKIENVLSQKYKNNDDLVIADIDQELLDKIPLLQSSQPSGFPSMKYMKGNETEDYEDSSIENKDRTIDSFVHWIESKISVEKKGGNNKTKSNKFYKKNKTNKRKSNKTKKSNKIKKNRKYKKKGGKWSMKYKKSINCRNPHGFSQKQHCKYGRNK